MITRRTILIGGGALAVAGVGATCLQLREMGSMADYEASIAATRGKASQHPGTEVREIIRHATLAANGHNTQPWRFRIGANRIEILPDLTRRTPAVDPDDHHLFVSLGCAAANLGIAGGALGFPGETTFDAAGDGSVDFAFGEGSSQDRALFDAIPLRQSTRAVYDGRPVSSDDMRALARAADTPGIDLVFLTDRTKLNQVRDLVLVGNSVQLNDSAFVRELKSWLRFSPRHAMATCDGLFSVTSGSPALPEWLGPKFFDAAFTVGAENDKYARQLQSSAGVAIFVSERDDKDHWVRAGQACQRFALQATALGIRHAFINQPVEVAKLRPELASLVGIPGRRPDIVMRFGYGPTLPYSARRPVEAVIEE